MLEQERHAVRSQPEKRIFILNGSAEFLELLREFLTLESYEVTVALTATVEFNRILNFQPDLLIIDVVVFQNDSWDLLERVHQDASVNQIPVIIVSTSPDLIEYAKENVERFGGDYYLAKPFDLSELQAKIEDAIGSVRSER